jgi:hypothetical protein
LNELDKNRQEAKGKKEEFMKAMKEKGMDWRKYKEEKKELKKRKRYAWMLDD